MWTWLMAALVGGLAGCAPKTGTVPKVDHGATVVAALNGSAQLADVGGEIARQRDDRVGCLVGRSLGVALRSSAEAVAARAAPVIPGVEVDVAACLALGPDVVGEEVAEEVELAVHGALGMAEALLQTQAVALRERDCPGVQWGLAALAFARGAVEPVVAEVRVPDGLLTIPTVPVGLEVCG